MRSVALAILFVTILLPGEETPALVLRGRIQLPNVNGRTDHFAVDTPGRRLFLAALGNRTVEVLDIQAGRHGHTIPNLPEAQGLYYDTSSNRLFAACREDGTTRILDGGSYQPVDIVRFASNADNIRYEPRGKRIIVGYGDGALAFLDTSGKRAGEIALDAHPESFQVEKAGTRAFVNVPDKKELQVVDIATNSVLHRWPVTSALKNYPMALDEAHHRVLIGSRAPARMLSFDTTSGKQTASIEIVGDTDDMFYDAAKRRVYVIGGEGFVDVLDQEDADHYNRVARFPTAPGARTGLFVADWRKLFVAVPHRGDQRAEVLVYEVQ